MLTWLKKYPGLWVTAIVSLLAHGVLMAWVSDWYESPMARMHSSVATSIEIKLTQRVAPPVQKMVAYQQPQPELMQAPVEVAPIPKKISTNKPAVVKAKKTRPLRKSVEPLRKIAKPMPEKVPVKPVMADVFEVPDQQQLDRIKQAYIQKLLVLISEKKFYPRRARKKREEGLVTVGFGIGVKGTIKNIRLLKSSGVNRLDKSALQVISGLGVFEPLPPILGVASLDVVVPMQYRLR